MGSRARCNNLGVLDGADNTPDNLYRVDSVVNRRERLVVAEKMKLKDMKEIKVYVFNASDDGRKLDVYVDFGEALFRRASLTIPKPFKPFKWMPKEKEK